jgi:hypothetical protein
MADIYALLGSVFIFAVALGYTTGCERLKRSRKP